MTTRRLTRELLLLAVGLALAALCSAQPASRGADARAIAVAAKSPLTLARYIEFHKNVDWDALWKALGTRDEPEFAHPLCDPCSTEIVTVSDPAQSILIIQGDMPRANDLYLRYLHKPNGEWQFTGERRVHINNGLRRHETTRLGRKTFLRIASDQSQGGAAILQELEDWLDLTQPGFEPVFSITVQGSHSEFSMAVGRTIQTRSVLSQASGIERIDVTLKIQFAGEGPEPDAIYHGVYTRPTTGKKFVIRNAYPVSDRRLPITTKEFEELADPFDSPSNEKLLVYALPGLRKIATGSDPGKKEWLQSVLSFAKDTPEKRELLKLLGNP